jgi:hypothetical protein|eukprot:COSAG06_NODE_51425_length_312_cov_0.845070_1_plen_54_part_10
MCEYTVSARLGIDSSPLPASRELIMGGAYESPPTHVLAPFPYHYPRTLSHSPM